MKLSSSPSPVTRPQLRWLDAVSGVDHLLLEHGDRCAWLAEYRPTGGRTAGFLERLMWQFKCRPSLARADPRLADLKRHALETLASWLRGAVSCAEAQRWTWVPVPPSRIAGDPDFDDRLPQVLGCAFGADRIDRRVLLRQRRSTPRDHRNRRRLSEEALFRLLEVDLVALREAPLREGIILFDDVLTSGKHFRCCVRRLREHLPAIAIRGLFLMRRVPWPGARGLGRAWY